MNEWYFLNGENNHSKKVQNKLQIEQILMQFYFEITIKSNFTEMKTYLLTTWLQKTSLQSLAVIHCKDLAPDRSSCIL